MKKFILLMLSLLLMLTFVACNNNDDSGQSDESKEMTEDVDTSNSVDVEKEEVDLEEESETSLVEEDEKVYVAGTVAVSEVMDALEIENVVGVPTTVHGIPERYSGATEIGRPMEPDMEIVKSLNSDLFISVTSREADLKPKLEQLNIEYLFIDLDSVENIKNSVLEVGEVANKTEKAAEIVENIEKQIADLTEKSEGLEKPKVLMLFGSPKSIMIATPKSYIGSLLESLNIPNISEEIVPNAEQAYLPINMEDIVRQDPDIIVRMTHANPKDSQAMMDAEFNNSEVWQSMRAVKEGRVIDLENGLFSVSGSVDVGEALERLYEHIYNEE